MFIYSFIGVKFSNDLCKDSGEKIIRHGQWNDQESHNTVARRT